MMSVPTTPRSIYAGKLREFPDFAFGDEEAFAHRGLWREFFARRIGPAFIGRVIFEIGCADAGYLARLAARFPATAFIGLDWKCKALYDGARRVAELGLGNIALLRGRGQNVFKIFGEREVDEIWVFHPDPCDRDVELKNRLIGEDFLSDVHLVLRDESSILALKTDHLGYYQWTLGLLGLPQPVWFKTSLPPDQTPAPRFRPRDLIRPQEIPLRSQSICSWFDVAMNSPDFWNDPAALAHTAGRCFSGEATLYESRFTKKRFPIYYVELRKR